jgi:hypothetical protein
LETPAELTVKMITLYDLSGSVLYTHDNVDNYLKINLDFLPKGLYFVEVKTDGETFHLRTIKQ